MASFKFQVETKLLDLIRILTNSVADPESSPPNPDPDPVLVVKKYIYVSVQYRAYVYLFTP
jgi:hypothetical protein